MNEIVLLIIYALANGNVTISQMPLASLDDCHKAIVSIKAEELLRDPDRRTVVVCAIKDEFRVLDALEQGNKP
jgi:hypothetical protein